MGCGASAGSYSPPEGQGSGLAENTKVDDLSDFGLKEGSQSQAVIVYGALGLESRDVIGSSDSYCLARIGPSGSAWGQKLRGKGWRSKVVASTNPTWNLAFGVDVTGVETPELHVRIYDADWLTEDDFLGEAAVTFSSAWEKKTEVSLTGRAGVSAKVVCACGPLKMLSDPAVGVSPSAYFEHIAPIGEVKSIRVEDVQGHVPLTIGTAPLPECLQGIYWLTDQGNSSALASFGASNDGGGCSTGILIQNRYKVRVSGDRVWAMAGGQILGSLKIDALDLIYHFVFNDSKKPTKCQIYPEARRFGVNLAAEWLLDFEMELVAGDPNYPGSVVWNRRSWVAGREATSAEYALVQVIDVHGKRIEPAWSKFVEYQSTQVTDTPGMIHYHEIPAPKSLQDAPAQMQDFGILVLSGKGLRDSDWLLTQKSDPYVVCRMGPVGSSWKEKSENSEVQSETIDGELNPVWQFAFPVEFSPGATILNYELHLRVFDSDVLSCDDFLGEMQLPLRVLADNWNDTKDYPLVGNQGSVAVMLGDRVAKALERELKQTVLKETTSSTWFSPVRKVLGKLGLYFRSALATPIFYTYMVQMARVWAASITKEKDPSVDWFLSRSRDPKSGEDTYRWQGPMLHSSTLSSNSEVREILKKLGGRLGTSNTNGEVCKPNFLGFNIMNNVMWPEVPWHSIGLACPQEVHAWVRPLLTKLSGPGGRWSTPWLRDMAHKFFHGRRSIVLNEDLRTWSTRVLHQVMVGIDLTEAEGAEFMEFQKNLLILAGAPEAALSWGPVSSILSLERTLEIKAKWIQRYREALTKFLPDETSSMSADNLAAFASAVADALLFAGGQSVPSVLQFALSVPYSKWGEENLPSDFSLTSEQTLPSYIWEIVRRFPQVSGFVISKRSFGNNPEQYQFLNLQMAQLDPKAFVEPLSFKLRPLAEYHKQSVGFAEPAVAPMLSSPNARACPARDLAMAMVLAFMREFAISMNSITSGGKDMHKQVWVARAKEPDDEGIHRRLESSEINISMFGTTSLILDKDATVAADMPAEELAMSAQQLENLSDAQKALIKGKIRAHNKFDDVGSYTKALIAVVGHFVEPNQETMSTIVKPPFAQAPFQESDIYIGPLPGMRMVSQSEQDEGDSALRVDTVVNAMVTAAFGRAGLLSLAEDEPDLMFFDSSIEAAASINATFGPYLPAQYNLWPSLDTDEGMANLCTIGIGAWYLTAARSAKDSGHEVPAGAAFEVNLEYMSKYETRETWLKYGHTLYLAPASEGEAMPKKLLGIWWCQFGKLVTPGDDQWEEVKLGFRYSLGTSVTLRDHLMTAHWIVGSDMQSAARETTSADHPLRRLLKQFYFGTADINRQSIDLLLPVNQFGWRTFAFSEEGWNSFFADNWSAWSWKPFTERFKDLNLPAAFLEKWPLKRDGELVWKVFEKYVNDFLRIFYATDESLKQDSEVVAFWAYFDMYHKWHLPELSFASLVALLADMIWWVTCGHEYLGSIVEYLTMRNGLPGKLLPGLLQADVQSLAQSLCLIALTGLRQPALMDDWTHLFQVESWTSEQRQAALDVVRSFQVDLGTCSSELEERNVERENQGEKRFVAFNPRILETSISI